MHTFVLFLRNKILNIMLTILLFVIFLDPNNNIFYIKDMLFISIIVLWLFTMFFFTFSLNYSLLIIFIIISIIIPIYGLGVMYINGSHFQITTPYLKSFFLFALLPVIVNLDINITQRFHYIGFLISFIVFVCFVLFYFSKDQFEIIYGYLVENKQVAVSRGYEYQGVKMFTLFYKTSPLLLFPLGYYFQRMFLTTVNNSKKIQYIFAICTISIVFIFSSTRANVIIFIVLLVIYSLSYIYKKNRKAFWISLVALSVFLTFFVMNFLNFFSLTETSNSIKLAHLIDYLNLFKSDFFIIIFGQGFNSFFYSTVYNTNIYITELSYFEFIRIFGLPMTLLFLYVLIYPIFVFYKNYHQYYLYRYIPISYIFYLIIAGSNPLLLSSTGMIVIVYVYSILFIISKNVTKSKLRRLNH